jgi:hypothetical protein
VIVPVVAVADPKANPANPLAAPVKIGAMTY